MIRPHLFIADEPPGHPQLSIDQTTDGKVRAFVREPDFIFYRNGRKHRGAYVLRYPSKEAFEADQHVVLSAQSHWKISFGVDEVAVGDTDGDADTTAQEIETLEAANAALEEDKARLIERAGLAEGARQAAVGEAEELRAALDKANLQPTDAATKDAQIAEQQQQLAALADQLREAEQLLEAATAPPTVPVDAPPATAAGRVNETTGEAGPDVAQEHAATT